MFISCCRGVDVRPYIARVFRVHQGQSEQPQGSGAIKEARRRTRRQYVRI